MPSGVCRGARVFLFVSTVAVGLVLALELGDAALVCAGWRVNVLPCFEEAAELVALLAASVANARLSQGGAT